MAGEISRMMKQRVLRRVDDTGNQVFTDAEVYCWLSEALRDIATRQPDQSLPELCVTATWGPTTSYGSLISAGDSTYALPSDFLREKGLKYADASEGTDRWATRIAHRELKQYTEVEAASAGTKPRYWIWEGNINLEVGTVAAADSFTFYYVKEPADYTVSVSTSDAETLAAETGGIDDDTDPTVSRHYFRAMEEFAVARCHESRKNWGRADTCLLIYEKLLQEVKARYVVEGDAADRYPNDGIGTPTANV